MGERLTAASLLEEMKVQTLTMEEIVVYEAYIRAAALGGAKVATLECKRRLAHWRQADPHMQEVSAHFRLHGFGTVFHAGHAQTDQRDDDHPATVTVSW